MDKKQSDKAELREESSKDIDEKDIKDLEEKEKNQSENKEVKDPEEEIKILQDKLARAFAEMENQRRRYEKEKDEAFEYGGFGFAKEALNLLDNLERAKVSLENDEELKNTDILKKVTEHLDIINHDMLSIFKKNKIEPIKTINEKLDPNLHQAMLEVEDDSKDPGTIVQEIQKGFTIKERLLRPSLVSVSKKKAKQNQDNNQKIEENSDKNKEN
tara:strand:- start:1557 stop:2201 length:645 start_codon:yes stop_codon:yes gene_type:complete